MQLETSNCANEKRRMERAILTYLTENPDAQDTLLGIAEWWLMEQEIKRQVARLKEALNDLSSKKLILERKGKDSQVHYRINRRKVKEIASLIK